MESNKDWTGNYASVFKTLGASNHTDKDREQHDFYATDPIAIDGLLSKVTLPHNILEPACGNGCLSKRLEDSGYNVLSYDLVDRGYGQQQNFFELLSPPIEGDYAIITNPPYKYAMEFVLHSLELVPTNSLVCMFLKTTFLEGKRRYNELFRIFPPEIILQFSERVLCAKNGDFDYMIAHGGSAVSYAWFCWRKGFKGRTVVDWI